MHKPTETELMVLDALYTDGGHHKQWYLEQILHKLVGDEAYKTIMANAEWETGIAP